MLQRRDEREGGGREGGEVQHREATLIGDRGWDIPTRLQAAMELDDRRREGWSDERGVNLISKRLWGGRNFMVQESHLPICL
jgi:hypothetical protein